MLVSCVELDFSRIDSIIPHRVTWPIGFGGSAIRAISHIAPMNAFRTRRDLLGGPEDPVSAPRAGDASGRRILHPTSVSHGPFVLLRPQKVESFKVPAKHYYNKKTWEVHILDEVRRVQELSRASRGRNAQAGSVCTDSWKLG